MANLEIGTHNSLLEAGNYMATNERRQELNIVCPKEIAFRRDLIDEKQPLVDALKSFENTLCGAYPNQLANHVQREIMAIDKSRSYAVIQDVTGMGYNSSSGEIQYVRKKQNDAQAENTQRA